MKKRKKGKAPPKPKTTLFSLWKKPDPPPPPPPAPTPTHADDATTSTAAPPSSCPPPAKRRPPAPAIFVLNTVVVGLQFHSPSSAGGLAPGSALEVSVRDWVLCFGTLTIPTTTTRQECATGCTACAHTWLRLARTYTARSTRTRGAGARGIGMPKPVCPTQAPLQHSNLLVLFP